jgi:hypothetical protein
LGPFGLICIDGERLVGVDLLPHHPQPQVESRSEGRAHLDRDPLAWQSRNERSDRESGERSSDLEGTESPADEVESQLNGNALDLRPPDRSEQIHGRIVPLRHAE